MQVRKQQLELDMDTEAWWATLRGAAESDTAMTEHTTVQIHITQVHTHSTHTSSKDENPCHRHQAWVRFQLTLHLLLLTMLHTYHLPPPLPPSVSNSSRQLLDAGLLIPAVILYSYSFTVLYYKIKSVFFISCVCFLCIMCVKSIINLL